MDMNLFQVILIAIAISVGYFDYVPPACGPVIPVNYNSVYAGKMKLLYVIAKDKLITEKCVNYVFGGLTFNKQGYSTSVSIFYQNDGDDSKKQETSLLVVTLFNLYWFPYLDTDKQSTIVFSTGSKSESGVITMIECLFGDHEVCDDESFPKCTDKREEYVLDYYITCNPDNCDDTVKESAKMEAERVANLAKMNVYTIDHTNCAE